MVILLIAVKVKPSLYCVGDVQGRIAIIVVSVVSVTSHPCSCNPW